MDFRWEEGGLVWFFLMIFFMLTASPTLLFPTSPFPQNSYVQNKVWPSWKPESSADVPPGKECGLCRSSRGALGRGEAEEGNCKQSWAPPAQAELTLLPLLHGSVTATNTLRVCSHSPYRGQTSHFSSPSRACTGNEFFVLPFFFLFAVGWVSILAHQGISTMSCRESTAREQPWDEERVETELLFSTTSWKISLTVTSAHPQPHRDKVHCIQMHTMFPHSIPKLCPMPAESSLPWPQEGMSQSWGYPACRTCSLWAWEVMLFGIPRVISVLETRVPWKPTWGFQQGRWE